MASAIWPVRSKISPRKNAVAMRCSWLAREAKESKLVLPASASSNRPSSSKTWHNKFWRRHFKSSVRLLVSILPMTASAAASCLLIQASLPQQEISVHHIRVALAGAGGGLEHAIGLGQKSDDVGPVRQFGQRPRLQESGAQGQGGSAGFWSK